MTFRASGRHSCAPQRSRRRCPRSPCNPCGSLPSICFRLPTRIRSAPSGCSTSCWRWTPIVSTRLSWVSRLIARGLGLGEILGEASWGSAEHHLRLAATLDPGQLVYPVELAKLLVRLERADEARTLLEDVVARTPRHALDEHYVEEARALLAGLTAPAGGSGAPGTSGPTAAHR